MERKEAKQLDLYIQYAIAATKEAMNDAKINMENENPERVGVIFSSAMGGIQATGENQLTAEQRGLRKVSAFLCPTCWLTVRQGGFRLNIMPKGSIRTVVSACATGTAACGEAYEILRRGDADVIIAGGSDAAITPLSLAGFDNVGALSQHNSDPTRASRPFDLEHDGFVIAEGAGTLILESEAYAKARGAQIYAEIIGYGSSGDAHHMTAPHDESQRAIGKRDAYGVTQGRGTWNASQRARLHQRPWHEHPSQRSSRDLCHQTSVWRTSLHPPHQQHQEYDRSSVGGCGCSRSDHLGQPAGHHSTNDQSAAST